MGEPPARLDGADILCWAVSARGGFYTLAGSDPPVTVAGIAVARYPDSERFYLFKCAAGWDVVQDWDCESAEDARALAAGHANGEALVWCESGRPGTAVRE